MSRGGSRRDGNDGDVSDIQHPDGWSVAGSQCAARPKPKAVDLSQFGKINKVAPMSFAPTSVFNNKKGDPKSRDSPMSRTAPSSKMFSMLRSSDEGDTLAPATISKGEVKAKIDEDVKEFFGIRSLDEAESYFYSLPIEHRHRLVDTLVMKSIEMKERDVKLVGDLFIRVRVKDLCSPAVFEEGFDALAELLDDLAVDIPKAWHYFAILVKGSGLDQDEERYLRIAEKTMDPDRLTQLL
jgi:translation initiation factor 4G